MLLKQNFKTMENQAAIEQLDGFIAEAIPLMDLILQTKGQPIGSHADAIGKVKEITLKFSEFKAYMLRFKETFNENDLPRPMRQQFMKIFMFSHPRQLYSKSGHVYLGDGKNTFVHTTDYVVANWQKFHSNTQKRYTTEVEKALKASYLLAENIRELSTTLKQLT
jgi:hypothetical protein